MQNTKVYLIANNLNPSEALLKKVRKIKLRMRDVVVVFNVANSELINSFSRIDISCHRFNTIVKSNYFGIGNDFKIQPVPGEANTFFFLNYSDTIERIIRKNNIQNRYKIHNANSKLTFKGVSLEFEPDRAVTTGLFYVFYFLNNYVNHTVNLIGFNLFDNKRKTISHNYGKELAVLDELREKSYIQII